jgi:hypothetical protein
MVYNTQDYWVFGFCPPSDILKGTNKHTAFRKLDLFPSSCEEWETLTLFGSLETANLSHWTLRSIEVSSL